MLTVSSNNLNIQCIESLASISSTDWNALNTQNNPFLKHEFLYLLEKHRCLENQHWLAQHMIVYQDGKLIAAIPGYHKVDSYGEFVFDWAWADAYQRAGKAYYPKYISAIPFSPILGNRILLHPDIKNTSDTYAAIIQYISNRTRDENLSSAHFLFSKQAFNELSDNDEFLTRLTWQYHWKNRDYTSFDDFLSALNSKRRKQIRKERRSISEVGVDFEVLEGEEIKNEHWVIFYDFYCSTFERKWGEPRFNVDFFLNLNEAMPENLVLILAKHNSKYIAGAFAVRSDDTLYGRHWGCNTYVQNLHFECCYYQTIEYCITNNIKTLDAGVQGEHKLFRGFEPILCHSYHFVTDADFKLAIADFLAHETKQINQQIKLLNQHIPYTLNI